MKKLFLILILLSGLTASAQRVSELTETTSTPDGLLISVSTPSGTNWLTRKITYANFTFRITTNFQAELVTATNNVTTNLQAQILAASNHVTTNLQALITLVSNTIVSGGDFIPGTSGTGTNTSFVGTEGQVSIQSTDRQLHGTNGEAHVFWSSGKLVAPLASGNGETVDWFAKELKHDWKLLGLTFATPNGATSEDTNNIVMEPHQTYAAVFATNAVRTVTLPKALPGKFAVVKRLGNSGNNSPYVAVQTFSGDTFDENGGTEVRIPEQRGSRLFVAKESGDGWYVIANNGVGAVFDEPQLANATFDSAFSISNEVATASAVTNYPISFTNAWPVITTANTNANLTFENLSAGKSLTVIFDAVTSTVPCVVSIPADLLTNANLNLTVTNGTAKAINFYAIDGTTTNILVSDGGVYSR